MLKGGKWNRTREIMAPAGNFSEGQSHGAVLSFSAGGETKSMGHLLLCSAAPRKSTKTSGVERVQGLYVMTKITILERSMRFLKS